VTARPAEEPAAPDGDRQPSRLVAAAQRGVMSLANMSYWACCLVAAPSAVFGVMLMISGNGFMDGLVGFALSGAGIYLFGLLARYLTTGRGAL